MDDVDGAAIDDACFAQFMEWFADPGIASRNADLADMLATQFGNMGWATSQSELSVYKAVMARRLVDKNPASGDAEDLLHTFNEHAGKAEEPEAAEKLADWLAAKIPVGRSQVCA